MNTEVIEKIDKVIEITADKVIKYNISINQHIGLLNALAALISARAEIKPNAMVRKSESEKKNGR